LLTLDRKGRYWNNHQDQKAARILDDLIWYDLLQRARAENELQQKSPTTANNSKKKGASEAGYETCTVTSEGISESSLQRRDKPATGLRHLLASRKWDQGAVARTNERPLGHE
jgi:hypothetical protein